MNQLNEQQNCQGNCIQPHLLGLSFYTRGLAVDKVNENVDTVPYKLIDNDTNVEVAW